MLLLTLKHYLTVELGHIVAGVNGTWLVGNIFKHSTPSRENRPSWGSGYEMLR